MTETLLCIVILSATVAWFICPHLMAGDDPDHEANKALIKEAPAMYDLLREVSEGAVLDRALWPRVRAVLAKARGDAE